MIVQVAVEFRLCTEQDLPALEWMGLFTTQREIIRSAFEAQRRGDALMLLALASGFPVAQAWIDFERSGGVRRPLMWAVRVFPPLQGRGLGSAIVRRAEALAQARGAEEIEIGVEKDNLRAMRFYERLGYEPAGERHEKVSFMFEKYPLNMSVDQRVFRKRLRSLERL